LPLADTAIPRTDPPGPRQRKPRNGPNAVVLWLVAVLVLAGLQVQAPSPAQAYSPVSLVVDGNPVAPDVPPQIREGRTMVPVRFVGEALGLDVTWNGATREVTASSGDTTVLLTIDSRVARVNGSVQYLEVPAFIVEGRTLVPVRFMAESLGCYVSWEATSRTVYIDSSPEDQALPRPTMLDMRALPLGQSSHQVLGDWGSPLHKYPGFFGIEWWAYRTGPGGLVRFGFRDDRLVAAYALGNSWKYRGLYNSATPAEVVDVLDIPDSSRFELDGHGYKFECSGELRRTLPVFYDFGKAVIFYRDTPTDRVPAVLVTDVSTLLSTRPANRTGCTVWYEQGAPPPKPVELTPEEQLAAERGVARALLDLVNTERELRGYRALEWEEGIAEAARAHSQDMADNDFLAHESPTTGTLRDRANAAGYTMCGVAENIAHGYLDAISVHHGWMNSTGHRQNVLYEGFRSFGAGVVGDYYTEEFLNCR